MGQKNQAFQLAVTFMPVIGIVLTAVLAIRLKGWQQWTAMIVVPLATYAVYNALASNGSLVAVITSIFYALLLCVYILTLLAFGSLKWLHRNDAEDQQ